MLQEHFHDHHYDEDDDDEHDDNHCDDYDIRKELMHTNQRTPSNDFSDV